MDRASRLADDAPSNAARAQDLVELRAIGLVVIDRAWLGGIGQHGGPQILLRIVLRYGRFGCLLRGGRLDALF